MQAESRWLQEWVERGAGPTQSDPIHLMPPPQIDLNVSTFKLSPPFRYYRFEVRWVLEGLHDHSLTPPLLLKHIDG